MPVTPIRRLALPATLSVYDEISREALSCGWRRLEVEATERDHPSLILRSGGSVIAALPGGGLAYAFESERAFVQRFPTMFNELLPKIRRDLDTDIIRFRLTHNPARPIVEPVLRSLGFELSRAWLRFALSRRPLPMTVLPPGVKIRAFGAADLEELIRLDRQAFPNTPMPAAVMRRRLSTGAVLVATAGRNVAGFALYERLDDELAHLGVLAVDDAFQGRGIGAALTQRVAKQVFSEGAQVLELNTEDGNSRAIALYIRLGFRQTLAGRDYARPVDDSLVARMKKSRQGTVIRFGGWR